MKKRIPIFTLLIVFVFAGLFVGCASSFVTQISAEQAYAMMNESGDFVLIDARTPAEFAQSRIRGAISIPYIEIIRRAPYEILDKDIMILVYCQSGRRSAIAARRLANLGFTNIYDFGGINSWTFGTISG